MSRQQVVVFLGLIGLSGLCCWQQRQIFSLTGDLAVRNRISAQQESDLRDALDTQQALRGDLTRTRQQLGHATTAIALALPKLRAVPLAFAARQRELEDTQAKLLAATNDLEAARARIAMLECEVFELREALIASSLIHKRVDENK